jgi:hypothetical protein
MPHAISVGEAFYPLVKPGTQKLKHTSSLRKPTLAHYVRLTPPTTTQIAKRSG